MRRLLSTLGTLVVIIAFGGGCGSPPSPTTPDSLDADDREEAKLKTNDEPGAPTGQPEEDDDLSEFDLSPVPAPAEVVVTARWKNPGTTLRTLASFASMPAGFVDDNVRSGLQMLADEYLYQHADTRALAEVISLDAPVDFVLLVRTDRVRPQPMWAVSVGLTSLRGARSAAKQRPVKIGPGLWRLGAQSSWGPPCVIAAAAGAAPGRLVCTMSDNQLLKMGPYMARTVAAQPLPAADFRAEAKLKGMVKRYGRMVATLARGIQTEIELYKIRNTKFDSGLMDTADWVGKELGKLVFDLDKIWIEAKVDGQAGIAITGAVELTGAKSSWFVKTALDGASKAGVAPPLYWHLPKDSETASYGYTADPARFNDLLKWGKLMIEGGLESERVATAADRKAIAKLVRFPIGKHLAAVSATGHFPPATSGTGGKATAVDLYGNMIGWNLYGVEAPSQKLRAYLQETVRTYNRPTLHRWLKKELGRDYKMLPTVKTVRAPAGSGAGTLDIAITFQVEDPMAAGGSFGPPPPPPTYPPTPTPGPPPGPTLTPITVHLLLMPDGKRTWLGLAGDAKQLATLMKTAKGTKPGPNSLASRPNMDVFRQGQHASGMMGSLQALVGFLQPLAGVAQAAGAPPKVIQQVHSIIAAMPHGGQSPIVAFQDVKPGRAPTVSLSFAVPKEALDDVGYLAKEGIKLVTQLGGMPSP